MLTIGIYFKAHKWGDFFCLCCKQSAFQTVFAEDGYYEEETAKDEFRFIAIRLPANMKLFPEVSTGPTRFSIHFKEMDDELSVSSYDKWFDFSLATYR